MNITEVRVKLVKDNAERLRAFCSVTLDAAFVIRDLKVIDGTSGPFVAMPSRKLADRCPKCGSKNHLKARFCNDCGARLKEDRTPRDAQGRVKLHADVAHPINTGCREQIQSVVIEAYRKELEAAKHPDYKPPAYDEDEDVAGSDYDELISELKESASRRAAVRAERNRPLVPADPPVGEGREDGASDETRGASESADEEEQVPVSAPSRAETRSKERPKGGFASGIL